MKPFAVLLAGLLSLSLHATAASRPNIVLIMSDDMGFSDLHCFGSEIDTPNLDALAKGGLKFTQFYNVGRCCPTRASLMTGLYPHQSGIGHMVDTWSKRGGPGYAGDLNQHCVTIAQVMHGAGYRTYMAGKWHVTPVIDKEHPDKHNWPLQRGFDRFYGTIHGAGSYYDPNTLTRDNEFISPYADPEYKPKQYYYTDAIADNASRFIADHKKQHQDQPFFMYVAFTAAHWPMQAKPQDIAKYKGKYDAGFQAIRTARYERLKQLGIIDSKWNLTQPAGEWSDVKDKEFETRCMEVYAAMVDCLDQGIGRIIGELKKDGLQDNTLVLFLQDNGGCAELMGRGKKFKATERADHPTLSPMAATDIQPDMIPKQTRDGYPMRQGYGVLPGGADTYIGYGREWANVSNTPFREYKHWVHEGGISTPLIAYWPKGIAKSQIDQMVTTPAHLIDIMATCADLGKATYPKELNGQKITPMEGISLKPAFEGKELHRSQPLFWEHEGNRAVRDGKWKLVAKGPAGKWELYDMSKDRTETHDIIQEHPDIGGKMIKQWEAWAHRAMVLPWTWHPQYGEAADTGNGRKKVLH